MGVLHCRLPDLLPWSRLTERVCVQLEQEIGGPGHKILTPKVVIVALCGGEPSALLDQMESTTLPILGGLEAGGQLAWSVTP
jgi:hypothetical protein